MSRRLDNGGTWIDRSKPLRFTFDGVEYEGFEGDTLASALLANDLVGGFRSPILGRPRGIYSAGIEEPNAFVEISEPWFDPIVAATMVELVDGLTAHSRAGAGRLPADRSAVSRRRIEHVHVHVEALVIGGGPSGRSAAFAAMGRNDRVLLLDEWHRIDDVPRGVTALPHTTAIGMYDDGYVVALERFFDLERLRHIRARRVVLATGAHERPIAFANCDLPGVMLASAARAYVERFGVLPGRQAAVLVTNDSGLEMADVLRAAGAEVVALADVRKGEADGIPPCRCGARAAVLSHGTRIAPVSCRMGADRGGSTSSVGRPARACPHRRPIGSFPRTICRRTSSIYSATRRWWM
jgi:sarcosine oxidase subunit alpha